MRVLIKAVLAGSLVLLPGGMLLAQSSGSAPQVNQSQSRNPAAASQANAELFYMIQQLQREIRELRGRVEEQGNKIDRLTRQGRDRYVDLDQRILELSSRIESSGPVASAAPEDGAAGEPIEARDYRQPGEQEREEYQAIQTLIRDKKAYDEAIGRLYDFIDKYPEGDLVVNAYYWLGEVYLVQPKLEQAKQAFTIVATRYRDHRKAPDAVYKLGITLDRQGNKEAARERMQTVIRDYPDSNAAKLARDYLDGST